MNIFFYTFRFHYIYLLDTFPFNFAFTLNSLKYNCAGRFRYPFCFSNGHLDLHGVLLNFFQYLSKLPLTFFLGFRNVVIFMYNLAFFADLEYAWVDLTRCDLPLKVFVLNACKKIATVIPNATGFAQLLALECFNARKLILDASGLL